MENDFTNFTQLVSSAIKAFKITNLAEHYYPIFLAGFLAGQNKFLIDAAINSSFQDWLIFNIGYAASQKPQSNVIPFHKSANKNETI